MSTELHFIEPPKNIIALRKQLIFILEHVLNEFAGLEDIHSSIQPII